LPPPSPKQRVRTINIEVLKVVVIVMGVMILAGFAVVGVTIYNRLQAMASKTEVEDGFGAGFGRVDVALPPGARLDRMTATGDRLLLWLETPQGIQIRVLDLATGAERGVFRLGETAP
jgi:hypothetical protein